MVKVVDLTNFTADKNDVLRISMVENYGILDLIEIKNLSNGSKGRLMMDTDEGIYDTEELEKLFDGAKILNWM